MIRGLTLLALLAIAPSLLAADKTPSAADIEFFEKKVRPLLHQHCYDCHSAGAKKVEGGLLLDTAAGVLKGGRSGAVVVPGKPAESLLITAVRYQHKDLKMPPKGKLSAEEILDLKAWVSLGVLDPRTDGASIVKTDNGQPRDSWPFKPVAKPTIPKVKDTSWPRNEVDRFILSHLEERGLKPSPVADKRVLIRRATFDLIGLPPTPEEIDAALNDTSADWFDKVIERLLTSPHYGERWGRHWLDVVRYADTAGDNSDYPIPQMFKYRNWVINAFNRDMPYDQLIREQLAGDLLPSSNDEDRRKKLIATGYLANARRFGSYEDARYPWHLTIEDTIDNLGRTFLGLTINCCRCHDHKFDPLSNEDYYALYGFFSSTRYPWPGIELDKIQRDLVPLDPAEKVAAVIKERDQKMAGFDATIKKIEADQKAAEQAIKDAADIKIEDERKTKIAEWAKRLDELKQSLKKAQKEREAFGKTPLPYETAYAIAEGKTEGKKKVGNACIQIKGDPEHLGAEVPRRFPTILGGQSLPTDAKGSGRLELAKWIADPSNPLTARVMANRIWQYHFGKGIVQTPSDFGKQGRPPTHPEMLDFLAAYFIEKHWSIKDMHRLIMRSHTYQMSSEDNEANERLDAGNELLWRFDRHRLDAEAIRDSLLAVSGGLDRTTGGAHPFPEQPTWDFTQHKPFKAVYESNRRSVYLMTQRIQRHPFLGLFDGADTNASTARRITSTTSLQALFLMNDPFVHEQAKLFAKRVMAAKTGQGERVNHAYALVFGRPPTKAEEQLAAGYFAKIETQLKTSGASEDQRAAKAWESFARVLFMSNEFVYLK